MDTHTPDFTLVSSNFIIRYYTVLSRTPHTLHHFYSERSTRTFGQEDEDAQPIKGTEEIKKHIEAQEFDQSQVELSAVDCQSSANGGIFISAVGHISSQDSKRKFTQTFFLEHWNDTYYVLNDIFRYLRTEDQENDVDEEEDEEDVEEPVHDTQDKAEPTLSPAHASSTPSTSTPAVQAPPAAVAAPTPSASTPADTPAVTPAVAPAATPTPSPAAPAVSATSTPTPSNTAATPSTPAASSPAHAPATHSKPESKPPSKPEPSSKPVAKPEARQPLPEKKAENVKGGKSEAKSGTWASIVKSDHETPAPAPQPQPQPQSQPQPTSAQNVQPTNTQASGKEREQKSSKSWPVLNKECSLYVSGLNYTTTHEQLMNAFSPYGKVTEIVLKASKGFAFIAFDSPQMVQTALDAIPSKNFTIAGQANTLVIEKRKPTNEPVTLPRHAPHTPHAPHTAARGRGRGAHRGGAAGSPRVPREEKGSSSPSPQHQQQSQSSQPTYAPKRSNNNFERRSNSNADFSSSQPSPSQPRPSQPSQPSQSSQPSQPPQSSQSRPSPSSQPRRAPSQPRVATNKPSASA